MAQRPERRTTMSKGMLGTLPLSKVLGPIGSLLADLAGEKGKKVLEELCKFNRHEPNWLLETQSLDAEITEDFDPKKFYQNNDFLWVDSDFINRIVSVAKPVMAGKKFNKASFRTLNKLTTGNELLEKYPKDVWDLTDLCVWLAMKIIKQQKGQKGTLLNNGYANLFLVKGEYEKVFVVYVYWSSVSQKWYLIACSLGSEWESGRRFFSKPTD